MSTVRSRRIGIDVVCLGNGDVIIAHAEPLLDGALRMRFTLRDASLFALLPNGMLDTRSIPLGTVGPDVAERLTATDEVVLMREDGERLVGGVIPLDKD